MRNKIKNVALLVIGMFLGAVLFGGAAYAATGVMAERSTNRVFVDGQETELDAYLIDGSNYVRLRDIAQAVGFNIYWDGAIYIESTQPYSGEISTAIPITDDFDSNVDYSVAANPEVFKGVYTRDAYNATYSVLMGLKNGNASVTAPLYIETQEDRWKLENMMGELSNTYTLSIRSTSGHGMYEVYAVMPDRTKARQYTASLIQTLAAMDSDREKVCGINDYLCDRVIYDPKQYAEINEITSSNNPVPGNCSSLSCAVNDLCYCLGIPCMRVSGEHHYWNLMYCDEAWCYTDISLNDQVATHDRVLCSAISPKKIADPDGVHFLQELLIPGSTKQP